MCQARHGHVCHSHAMSNARHAIPWHAPLCHVRPCSHAACHNLKTGPQSTLQTRSFSSLSPDPRAATASAPPRLVRRSAEAWAPLQQSAAAGAARPARLLLPPALLRPCPAARAACPLCGRRLLRWDALPAGFQRALKLWRPAASSAAAAGAHGCMHSPRLQLRSV